LTTVRGALAPGVGDVVDLYHFDVATLSDVRLRLEGRAFSISLLTFGGGRLASGGGEAERTLGPGHYVAAVRASFGQTGGSYRLSRHSPGHEDDDLCILRRGLARFLGYLCDRHRAVARRRSRRSRDRPLRHARRLALSPQHSRARRCRVFVDAPGGRTLARAGVVRRDDPVQPSRSGYSTILVT